MPTKNFFLLLLLAPTCSSHYPFLYSIRKRPMSNQVTGTSLNCTIPFLNQPSGMMLNCNLTQTLHNMPSSHVGHLGHLGHLGHWMYCGMPSSPYIILGHLGQLGHPSHLSHLGHLGNIGDLDPLDPSPLDPAPTDSLPGAFIIEMDPTDPGPSEGCHTDNLLDPLHTNPLESLHKSDPPRDRLHKSDALDGHGPTLGIFLDALDEHDSTQTNRLTQVRFP
jgi:hypothetical protein